MLPGEGVSATGWTGFTPCRSPGYFARLVSGADHPAIPTLTFMPTTAISSLTLAPVSATKRPDSLRHLPVHARTAYEQFQAGGDPAALGPVVLAILTDFSPRRSAVPLGDLPGDTQLIADLGFDSLAITEVVFTAEDLFGISITNEDIVQVRTLDDLLGFIQVKVADRRMA